MIESINEWGQMWLRYLGYSVVQNTIFLALIFLILHRMRNVSARFRYVIAFIGLTKLFLPNIIPAPLQIHLARPAGTIAAEVPVIIAGTVPVTAGRPASPAFTASGLLFLVWLIVAGTLILLPAFSTLKLKLRLRDARMLPADGLLPAGISLYKSERVAIPMSIGLFPREIYVPGNWDAWSPDCQTMILSHELAHIRRLDGLARVVQSLAGAIYFFHPLVWLLNRRVDELREMACDDSSISQGRSCSSVAYSRALVEIAETMTSPGLGCGSASALIKKRQELYSRIRYQMEARMKTISTRTGMLLIGIVMAAGFMLSFNGATKQNPAEDRSISQDIRGTIGGTVHDALTGIPLQGVSIKVKDSNKAAVSDENGTFRITGMPEGSYDLEIAYSGYEKKIVPVKLGKDAAVMTGIQLIKQNAAPTVVITAEAVTKKDQTAADKVKVFPRTKVSFVAFDTPPEPAEGWAALQKNLVYPQTAIKEGIEGTVQVETHFDTEGNILGIKILRSIESLDEAAIDAVKKTPWKPALQEGKPVEVRVAVPVRFQLKESDTGYGRIRGQVLNEKTNVPVPDVIITIAQTSLGARTDEQGIYIIDRVPPGSYTVSAITKKRLLAAKTDITLRAKTTVFVDFAVDPDKAVQSSGNEVFFVAFEEAPEPVGGWAGLQKNLVYPELALKAGIEGTVRVNAHIDTAGNVLHTKILQGLDSGCDDAAMEAVKKTKWKPAMQKGEPVEVWVGIPVRFQMKKDEGSNMDAPAGATGGKMSGVAVTTSNTRTGEFTTHTMVLDRPPVPVDGWNAIHDNLVYPTLAKMAGIEGTVLINTFIGTNGRIKQTQITQNVPGCTDAALTAVRRTKFEPALKNGKPVETWISIPVTFELEKNTSGSNKLPYKNYAKKGEPFFTKYETGPCPVGGWETFNENLVYPSAALKNRIEGIVSVYAHIDEKGNLLKTKIAAGVDGLNEAAVAAITKTEWLPGTLGEKPVEVWAEIPVRFSLAEMGLKNSDKQKNSSQLQDSTTDNEVFFVAFEVAPEPIGGWSGLQKHLVYPRTAREAGIEGTVRVNAHIDTAGNVLHTKILQGLGGGCSEAAMEAVKKTKWKPAMQKGKPVNVWAAIPVRFRNKEKG